MSNPLSGLNSTATLLQAKQLVGLSKLSKNQPTFNHLYPPTGKNFHLSRLTIIGRVASLKARPGSRWWVRWLYIGDCSGLIGFLKLLIYKVYDPGLLVAISPPSSSQICLSPGLRRIAKCLWKNVFPGGQDWIAYHTDQAIHSHCMEYMIDSERPVRHEKLPSFFSQWVNESYTTISARDGSASEKKII